MKTIITILIIFIYTQALSETLVEDFSSKPENRWQFFTDQVMGGVSSGNLEFIHSNDISYARMFGNVSTANNGGFIQFRSTLGAPLNENIKGIKLKVRGNNQQYFVHLRTTGSLLPWQYYSSGFDASDKWNEIKIAFDDFKKSSTFMRSKVNASNIRTVGLVAYGRDHNAELEVSEVSFY